MVKNSKLIDVKPLTVSEGNARWYCSVMIPSESAYKIRWPTSVLILFQFNSQLRGYYRRNTLPYSAIHPLAARKSTPEMIQQQKSNDCISKLKIRLFFPDCLNRNKFWCFGLADPFEFRYGGLLSKWRNTKAVGFDVSNELKSSFFKE